MELRSDAKMESLKELMKAGRLAVLWELPWALMLANYWEAQKAEQWAGLKADERVVEMVDWKVEMLVVILAAK